MQASNKPVIWSVAIAVVAMLVFGGFGYSSLNSQNDILKEKIDGMEFPTALEIANAVVLPEMPVTESDKIDSIYEDIFETDFWEAEAEVMALDEIEDDDYEVLYDFMTDANGLDLNIDDEKDINSVIVKDVTVTSSDVDDKDATVEYDLKVYYENADGDDKKVYLTVTVTILDNDVEDVDVIETI